MDLFIFPCLFTLEKKPVNPLIEVFRLQSKQFNYGLLTANEHRTRGNVAFQVIAVTRRGLLTRRVIRVPNATLARRRHVPLRNIQ